MSNKTEKQTRQANILTLGVSDLAPIVGSIIADKDTIIIKKMPNGGAAVFFSDQNGNVIGNEANNKDVKSEVNVLTRDDIFYLKNILHSLEDSYIYIEINSQKFRDLKLIIYINGNEIKYNTCYSRIYVKEGDVIEMKSSDYPNMNFAIDGELALGDGKDFRMTATEIGSVIQFYDLPELPLPIPEDEELPERNPEADIVWEKNIRVFFPINTQYSIEGENRWGNGWTDIRLYANSEGFVVNGSRTGEGNIYAAEENSALMYGDNGGVPVNLILNFNDVEEGMTLTFFKLAD